MAGLRRFWLEFAVSWSPDAPATALLYLGVGISGWDLDDCLEMLRVITHTEALPATKLVVEDVDVSQLIPTGQALGVPVWRGVWHPSMNLQSSGRWDSWAPWRDIRASGNESQWGH